MFGFIRKARCCALLALLLFSSACAQSMHHPTKDSSEWAADHAECEKIVRESIRESPDAYDIKDEVILIRKCMQQKGWKLKQQ